MPPDVSQATFVRFSTRDLPVSDRVPFLREILGRQIVHLDIEPQAGGPFEQETAMLAVPGLRVLWANAATPARWTRTPEMLADGDDAFTLVVGIAGNAMRSQRGRDVEFNAGEGVGILQAEVAAIRFRRLDYVAAIVPRPALTPLVRNVEEAATRLVPRNTPALRLLGSYLATLRRNPQDLDPTLAGVAANHVGDLIALAVGATRDGHVIARTRGAPAGRLAVIKSDLAANPALGLDALAALQGVTPRYVQMLFEAAGTTFTIYAMELRLRQVRRMLAEPRFANRTITEIAYAAGFGDLSHFNRAFRRRYGCTPSDVRAATR